MDEFQEEFTKRLQAVLGEQLFNNIGQSLRLETMARENAQLQLQVIQLQPKEEA